MQVLRTLEASMIQQLTTAEQLTDPSPYPVTGAVIHSSIPIRFADRPGKEGADHTYKYLGGMFQAMQTNSIFGKQLTE